MIGLFEDQAIDLSFIRRGYIAPIPQTGWQRPDSFPEHYIHAARIAYDVETRETDFEHGAGWGRGLGYVVGVSIAAQFHDGNIECKYFPIAHDMEQHNNMNKDDVIAFCKRILENDIPKVGANLMYDMGWMNEIGVFPRGIHLDVQFAEALMSNEGVVNLEYLGQKYCNEGKTTDMLYDWIRRTFPKTKPTKVRQHIWQSPPSLVGYYAEQDSILPLRILEKQWQILHEGALTEVYLMECKLIPLLVQMRRAGVTVDIAKTLDLRDELKTELDNETKTLYANCGHEFNYSSGTQLGRVCDALGLKYPRTQEGAPSFQKDWMKAQTHPFFSEVNNLREKSKIISTFIESYILGGAVNGKLHCSFHPLRSDDGGTRTGRFSSSDPNLQNIPVRTALGAKLRELFIPDYGHQCMYVGDYSQIEYRTLAHFAVGDGSEEVRQRYVDDPTTDYHDMTIALVKSLTGMDIPRKYIKNINFGLLYGMSPNKLAAQLGIAKAESMPIFDAYHGGAPYVKATMSYIADEADMNGFVRTIMGRKGYFEDYVPYDGKYDVTPLPHDQAIKKWGYMIERAKLYKAVNYKIQGSAADTMKMAMVAGLEAGIFDITGVPRLTVHDELVFSVSERTKIMDEALKEFVHIAENCLPFSVPLRFESDYGSTWAEAK